MSNTQTAGAGEQILAAMRDKYRELTGFDSDDASDIGIRLRVLAGVLATLHERMDELEAQAFPQTGTGEYLDRHAAHRGLSRKGARQAEGVVRFSREVAPAQDILIRAGVVLATRPEPQLQFATIRSGVLPAGETQVDIPAQAVEGGTAGNVAAGAVCLMVSAASGITAVTNPAPFSGGVDGEGDEALRERILRGYRDMANGANSTFYYETAMGCEGVASVNVVPRARGRGTVDVIVACASPAAQAEAVQAVQAELDVRREINVDILVRGARTRYVGVEALVAIDAYAEYDSVSIACNETIRRYVSGLGVGDGLLASRLAAELFGVAGVRNVHIAAPAADIVPEADEVLQPGSIAVRRLAVAG